MRILLTGATGFLGSHLARGLLNAGHELWATRRVTSDTSRVQEIESRLHWLNLDQDFTRLCSSMPVMDAVVHSAAIYGREGESMANMVETNTLFPLKLLQAVRGAGTAHWINTDSALPREFNAYSLSKAQFADWGRQLTRTGSFNFINVRLEQVYGPGDDESKFPCYVINNCRRNVPNLRLSPGEQRRDFIHVADVVSAYQCLLENLGTMLFGWKEIPLGSGEAVRLRDFAELVKTVTDASTHLAFGEIPYRPHEIMYSVADLSQMSALGWSPTISLADGIQRCIEENIP